ncbi:MAG: hypothetical protein IRZ16_22020, partial [Myxococcaceae bacterium]|nr:hypothetical protein [Myxococcaceae bacterium]
MAWTVRTEDGSLEFESLGEIERAYRNGLVAPEDEVRAPGSERWQRADSLPVLRRAAGRRTAGVQANLRLGVALSIALAVAALWLIANGMWLVGLVVAIGL